MLSKIESEVLVKNGMKPRVAMASDKPEKGAKADKADKADKGDKPEKASAADGKDKGDDAREAPAKKDRGGAKAQA